MARPGRREDGAATKQSILEAAGEVFAEKGFGQATGKEIAERAGTNSAAVNYYFGGIDGLYAEVLVEAHHRLFAYEILKKISDTPGSPHEKLNAFINGMFRAVLGPASSTWPLRILGREMLTPSPAFPSLLAREILPKKQLATAFISEILGVPPDHPAVARCGLSIIAPFALLLVGNSQMLAQAAPTTGFSDPNAVIQHFQKFIAGGLSAIAADMCQE
ncbi:MAG TPA: CerR family C-terminal domain-containing protein [Candidatus Sulfotelmatobacter sp.]|jgi:AcrR family transcriptional regulator|nr:CerR family C-terminal domain-containing protein [Candidatus Sulfotelmatobacter sp.]